jgi:glycosyltransferase involved in cell wall biosynthesis
LRRRFPQLDLHGEVVGLGVDEFAEPEPDQEWDQMQLRIGKSRFILYAGRIDESKGCKTLIEYFMRYVHDAGDTELKLLMVGKRVMPVSDHPQVILAGFVPDETKLHAIRNCRLMVLPSPYESLSIAALEAWMLEKPVFANGNCAVLRGQCIRSNGGLWYSDYAEFRAGMDCLMSNDTLAATLGIQGKTFVKRNYTWQEVDQKLDSILASVAVLPECEMNSAAAAAS